MNDKHRKISKFIISGGSAAFIEYGVFLLLSYFLLPLLVVNTISFFCGLVVSFTLNKTWVFSNKGNTHKQIISYAVLAITNVVIANSLIWIFVEYVGIYAFVAKLIVMAMIAVWNFMFFSRFIFKEGLPEE